MAAPIRKRNRLKDYNYSANGMYFITICTKDRKNILSSITQSPTTVMLTEYGQIVLDAINGIHEYYPNVFVEKYVIMPNHVHLLLSVDSEGGRLLIAPTVSRVIKQLKSYVTKSVGFPLWQNSFYDHIIRDENDFLTKYRYIDTNPANWLDDEYNT